MYKDDSVERIFRLGGEDLVDGDKEGYVEDEDEECPSLEEKELSERFEIFSKYHNSIVGHFGIGNTLKAMSLGGQQWKGMIKDVTKWIEECAICQKIKWREGQI